ncbi:hypothetical protein RB594_004019 [Gaeumannomyces avenae]
MPSPRTLLGPLTTAWTPPSICTMAMAGCGTCTTLWQGQSCNPERRAHDWTDCWPPRSAGVPDPGVMMGWGLYSPAYECPAGYSTAALATSGAASGWSVGYSMAGGETAVACCPSGYSISSVVATGTTGQTCVAVVTSTTSLSTVQCISGSFANFNLVTLPNTDSPGTYTVFAPLFQLNHRAQDLSATTATTGSSSTPSTAPGGSAPGPPSQPAETSQPPSGGADANAENGGGGLTLGTKVGIGVGAGALAVCAVVLLLLAARALRRRRAARPVGEPLPGEGRPLPREPELGGTEVRELEACEKPRELAGHDDEEDHGDVGGAGSRGLPEGAKAEKAGVGAGVGAGGGPVFELEGSRPG